MHSLCVIPASLRHVVVVVVVVVVAVVAFSAEHTGAGFNPYVQLCIDGGLSG